MTFYKISYIRMTDQEAEVITTTTTLDGLNNLLDDPLIDVIDYYAI